MFIYDIVLCVKSEHEHAMYGFIWTGIMLNDIYTQNHCKKRKLIQLKMLIILYGFMVTIKPDELAKLGHFLIVLCFFWFL